jgi:hypothetical protein
MFVRQVALVSEVADIPVKEVARISAALQKQVTRDFAPIWQVQATVDGFPALEDVPLGYWPVIIVQDVQGAAGFTWTRRASLSPSWRLATAGR